MPIKREKYDNDNSNNNNDNNNTVTDVILISIHGKLYD